MEDTCFESCRYRDKKDKYKTTCPDYMELSWQSESGEVRVTHDCAKRRSLLVMMNWDQRLLGVQRASESERNASHELVGKLGEIIQVATNQKVLANECITLLPE